MFLGEIEMGINDIINSMRGKVKDIGGRVKNYFGKTISPNKIERVDVSKRRGNGAGLLYFLLAAATIAAFTNKLKAETFNVDPSMSVDQINQVIAGSEPNDVINFMEGSYNISFGKRFDFLPNREYTFDDNGVIINGSGLEHDILIGIANGGNMNISGNLTLQNSKQGIKIGAVPYDNINISGVRGENIYFSDIFYENRKHPTPLGRPAFNITNCIGSDGIKFVALGEGRVDETTPYPALKHCGVKNKTSDGGTVDLPRYSVVSYAMDGTTILTSDVVLGQNDQVANVFENCTTWDPNLFQFFESPIQNRYLNAINAFYGKPEDDNMDVDANDFYNEHPVMFKNAHLGDGTGAGPFPLVATMNSVAYFISCYLSDPNSPNWDPRADSNGDLIINLIDFANVADKYVGEDGEPISKATNLPEGQFSPGQNDYAVAFNAFSTKDIVPSAEGFFAVKVWPISLIN